jgi:hypothetical protein
MEPPKVMKMQIHNGFVSGPAPPASALPGPVQSGMVKSRLETPSRASPFRSVSSRLVAI